MIEKEESCDGVVDESRPNTKEVSEASEQQQSTYCPYCMGKNCPMMAQAGAQYVGAVSPVGQGMPNWWQSSKGDSYMGYGMQPSVFSDVWTQSQPSCAQNCMQDMYMHTGVPVHAYGYNMNGIPNPYMYGLNQAKIIDRDSSSYGSCCNPYGLGRY